MENLIFELVNEKRTESGKDPFVLSERVRLIARLHSKDMADRAFFNHTNPEGRNLVNAIKRMMAVTSRTKISLSGSLRRHRMRVN